MKPFETRILEALFLTTLWGIFTFLFLSGKNPYQLENILGLLVLVYIPGRNILSGLQLPTIPPYIRHALSVALSLLSIMVVVLVGNFILPRWFGVSQPLLPVPVFFMCSMLYVVTMVFALTRRIQHQNPIRKFFDGFSLSLLEMAALVAPVLLVFQSIAGAFALNNGGTDHITLALLAELSIYFVFITLVGGRLRESVVAYSLSLASLSLLLMTSMRGWYITGHDIQREFHVFMLAWSNGVWDMSLYRDAYNACLSITILPTAIFGLLHLSNLYVYKFLFQIFFALVPGVVYFINRHWMKTEYAILSTLFFVAFPTFYIDMPFLIRQEIAFLFYGLLLYILFSNLFLAWQRNILCLFMAAGTILSHYSTTYTVILGMAIAIMLRPLANRFIMWRRRKGGLSQSALNISDGDEKLSGHRLTIPLLIAFMLMSFLWTTVVTKTGGSVTRVVMETLVAVRDGFTESSRSMDVVNLISFKTPNQQQGLNEYISTEVPSQRASAPPSTYYPEASYQKYKYVALTDERRPQSTLGKFIDDALSIDSTRLIAFSGQLVAKFMMLLAPLGLFYVLLRRRYLEHLHPDYYYLAVAAFIFVAMNILLPVLSTEYGIYRALQQSLFVFGFLIVVAAAMVGDYVLRLPSRVHAYMMMTSNGSDKKDGLVFPIVIATLFFLYASGFLPQLFGGNSPLLHLNNSGRYYDTYLIRSSEVSAINWLSVEAHKSASEPLIDIDHSSANLFTALGRGMYFSDGIYPGLVHQDGFVFVTSPTYMKERSIIVYKGNQIVYSYPIGFLDGSKNLLYDDGSSRIYR